MQNKYKNSKKKPSSLYIEPSNYNRTPTKYLSFTKQKRSGQKPQKQIGRGRRGEKKNEREIPDTGGKRTIIRQKRQLAGCFRAPEPVVPDSLSPALHKTNRKILYGAFFFIFRKRLRTRCDKTGGEEESRVDWIFWGTSHTRHLIFIWFSG